MPARRKKIAIIIPSSSSSTFWCKELGRAWHPKQQSSDPSPAEKSLKKRHSWNIQNHSKTLTLVQKIEIINKNYETRHCTGFEQNYPNWIRLEHFIINQNLVVDFEWFVFFFQENEKLTRNPGLYELYASNMAPENKMFLVKLLFRTFSVI